MKRFIVFMLLIALSVALPIFADAQPTTVAGNGVRSAEPTKKQQRMFNKTAKKQRKAMKKFGKAQRKTARKGNRHPR